MVNPVLLATTLYACNVGERAYEWSEKGYGVFSYYFLEGLIASAQLEKFDSMLECEKLGKNGKDLFYLLALDSIIQ